MVIQVAEIAADEQAITDAAAQMYNELVASGEDPVDAAWLVDEAFGFTKNGYHHRRDLARDPFAPDYDALSREPLPATRWRDSMEAAGVAGIDR